MIYILSRNVTTIVEVSQQIRPLKASIQENIRKISLIDFADVNSFLHTANITKVRDRLFRICPILFVLLYQIPISSTLSTFFEESHTLIAVKT